MESMSMWMSRSCPSRLVRAAAGMLLVLGFAVPGWLRAADTVSVRSEPGGNVVRVNGTVVEFTGDDLVLRHTSGREEKIPSERVIEIVGDWKPTHALANERFAAGEFAAARDRYREALRDEDRRWVKRRILAQLTWCCRYLDQTDEAVKFFVPLYHDDPKTPHFEAIPLTWTTGQPDLNLERRASVWLDDQGSAVSRLIGASWLLSSARRADAIAALRQLVSDPDPRVVYSAEAQLWRTQIATSDLAETNRWQERIERMPASIRGGPCYVFGLGLSRQGMHEQAALNLLRTVILHPAQRDLVPHALLAAARELETMEQSAEAVGLYREILTKYESNRVAIEAENRLKNSLNAPP